MRLARACLVLGLLLGCGTDTDISDRPLFPDGFIVFQAVVLNGLDGSAVPEADVNLRIQIGRHTLQSEVSNGIHVIYGVPDNTAVFVLADAPGLAPFVAKLTIDGTGSIENGDFDFRFFNVLMYPVGTAPGDLTVTVFSGDGGTPVQGATVVATQDQQPVFVPVDTPLFPGVGVLPSSVIQTTDASGRAVFPGADLVLGARYSIDVFGAIVDGVFLVPSQNQSITIGSSVPEIVVFLNRPLLTPVAITSNNEDGAIHNNLVVRFPYAIELCTPTSPLSWTNSSGSFSPFILDLDGDGTVAQPALTNPVSAVLSDGNSTLTVEESYGIGTQAFDVNDDLFVTFNNIRLKPESTDDASCRLLNQVELRDTNTNVVTTIHVNDP